MDGATPDIKLPGGNGRSPGCVRGQLIVLRGGQGNGWPAFIRSQLACGAYTVVGRQMVGGVNAIKITGASGAFTFWVNPATYLPVQMTLPQQRTEFHWLPATQANLAQLKVTVPGRLQAGPRAQGACAPRSRGRGYIDDRSLSRRRPARPGGSRPGPTGRPVWPPLASALGGGQSRTRVATHSTWWVMGKASNARSAPSCQPASANTAMSRASVAGSQDT